MPASRPADVAGSAGSERRRYRVLSDPVSPDSFGRQDGRRHRRSLGLALAAIAVVYASIALALPAEVFWSPDEGTKLLQALSRRDKGSRAADIPYGGRGLDPDLTFYPRLLHPRHPAALRSILYPQPTADGGVRVHWPVAFPAVSLVAYRAVGPRGLYLMPILGGLMAAAAAGAIGRTVAPSAAAPAALAVGLATPVLFLSQLFWEHTPATAYCLIGVLLLVRSGGKLGPRLVGAAAAFAVAVALRPETLLLVAVVPLALALMVERRPEGRRRLPRGWWILPAGACVFAAVVVGLRPDAGAVVIEGLQSALARARALVEIIERASALLSPFPSRLTDAWFDLDAELGPALPRALARLGTTGALVAVAAAALREPFRGWAVAAGGSLVLIPSLWVACSPEPYRAIHALILPAPYLVLVALLLRPPPSARRPAALMLGLVMVFYLAIGTALAMTKMVGGLEWGNRYLLTLTAIGAVVAVAGAATYGRRDGERRPRLAVVAVTVLCLVTGGLYQARGVRELIISKRVLDECRREVLEAGGPVVTDLYWLPAAIAGTFATRPVFTLAARDDLERWVGRVGRSVDRFRVITGDVGPDVLERWIESVPAPNLGLAGVRKIPGLVIADVETADAVEGEER